MVIFLIVNQVAIPGKLGNEQVIYGKWIAENLSIRAEDGVFGMGVHLLGRMESLRKVPVAYIRLDTGNTLPDSIVVYVKGKGKYRFRLLFMREGQILSKEVVVEASSDWRPVVLTTESGLSIVGGLLSRPDARVSTTLYVMPYYTKDSSFEGGIVDLHLSPVFIK